LIDLSDSPRPDRGHFCLLCLFIPRLPPRPIPPPFRRESATPELWLPYCLIASLTAPIAAATPDTTAPAEVPACIVSVSAGTSMIAPFLHTPAHAPQPLHQSMSLFAVSAKGYRSYRAYIDAQAASDAQRFINPAFHLFSSLVRALPGSSCPRPCLCPYRAPCHDRRLCPRPCQRHQYWHHCQPPRPIQPFRNPICRPCTAR
jgi:hypothetical protein